MSQLGSALPHGVVEIPTIDQIGEIEALVTTTTSNLPSTRGRGRKGRPRGPCGLRGRARNPVRQAREHGQYLEGRSVSA